MWQTAVECDRFRCWLNIRIVSYNTATVSAIVRSPHTYRSLCTNHTMVLTFCDRRGNHGTRDVDSWSQSACAARSVDSSTQYNWDSAAGTEPACKGPSRSLGPRRPPAALIDTSTRTGLSRSSRHAHTFRAGFMRSLLFREGNSNFTAAAKHSARNHPCTHKQNIRHVSSATIVFVAFS
jgi:hypothetical protein